MARIKTSNRNKANQSDKEKQREAVKWFIGTLRGVQRDQAEQFNLDPNLLLKNRRETVEFIPGQFYFYRYDPKTKDSLPYYDTAPLIMLLDIYEDGFLAINVHYLPYHLRNQFIKNLLATITAKKWDHKTKAKITYAMVKTLAKYDIAKPAIKRYLFSHFRSKIVRIQAENWDKVGYLPIERFTKATKQRVWRDTERALRRPR